MVYLLCLQGEEECVFRGGKNVVNFDDMVQARVDNPNRQRKVKRVPA